VAIYSTIEENTRRLKVYILRCLCFEDLYRPLETIASVVKCCLLFNIKLNSVINFLYYLTVRRHHIYENRNNQIIKVTEETSAATTVIFNFLAFISELKLDGLAANVDQLKQLLIMSYFSNIKQLAY
jgi:hypothetical protein